ncbi:GRAS family transcription factor [Euphorbia peplus]|nr:GRAS family transcription factor [Euphorbia peplus]
MDPKYTDEFNIFPYLDQIPDTQIQNFPNLDPPLNNFDEANDIESSDPALRYISQILMEDDPETDESFLENSPGNSFSSPSDNEREALDPVLKYISQMLLEENMEDKPHMFYDPLALKATEQSLFDVLSVQDPSFLASSNPTYVNHESPDSTNSGTSSDFGGTTSTSTATNTSSSTSDFLDPQFVGDVREFSPVSLQTSAPYEYYFESNNLQPSSQVPVNHSNGPIGVGEMVQNMFTDQDSVLLFQRGVEEASKFLPKPSQLVIDLESNEFVSRRNEDARLVVVKDEKVERANMPNGSRGRKNHERAESDSEQERSSKQSLVYVEENEISEMFDKVLLLPGMKGGQCCPAPEVNQGVKIKTDEKSSGPNGGITRGRKQTKKKNTVDLRSLLILCAQAVSVNDFRTANELLKQIWQHASPSGDSSQRLAHYFANGLEARMAGSNTGLPHFHSYLISKKLSAADMLKTYKTHLYACPFKKLSILYANKMILNAAENATTLHIIDFGVMYGYQWPILIQLLSMEMNGPNGPPKLRITGIELPQQGFRPAERIIETGRRLARYCERFKVPFEYNPIASNDWENIPIEDLKIKKGEVVAVNCIGRFKNLLDETAGANCPRDEMLGLIRKINPNIFVHCISNGSYNAPFFVTRFREAVFHFSSLFDMFDSILPREDPERMMFEREFYGREAINVVACEGAERVERPETYKQWQSRTIRAGFKQLPLDKSVMEKCTDKLKTWYHKDFVIDEDNQWMLQGWKGRIIYASSCWVPA